MSSAPAETLQPKTKTKTTIITPANRCSFVWRTQEVQWTPLSCVLSTMFFAAFLSLFGLDQTLVRAINELRGPRSTRLTTDSYWLFFFAGSIAFGTVMWAAQTLRGPRPIAIKKSKAEEDEGNIIMRFSSS